MYNPFKSIARFLHSRALSVVTLAVLVICLMVAAYIRQPYLLKMIDHKLYDTIMSVEGPGPVSPVPVIIDLDEATLEDFGQWPWPRFLISELMYKLFSGGVAAVGLDMMLVEQDRSSPSRLREDLKRFMDIDVEFEGLPAFLYDYDELMLSAIRDLPIAMGLYLYFDTEENIEADPPGAVGYVVQKTDSSARLEDHALKASAAAFPYKAYRDSIPLGLINMSPDEDGVVRRIPLLAMVGDKAYPTLSLRALMLAEKSRVLGIRMNEDGIESIRVGQRVIPTNPDGSFAVPFKGRAKTFPYYSAADILRDKVPTEALAGRICFLGTSAPGLLDIRISPLDRVYPGVEVHATVLDAVLQGNFLHSPAWTPGAQVLGIIIGGLMAALAFGFASPVVYSVVGGGMLAAAGWSAFYFFRQGYIVSPLYVAATILVMSFTVLILRFWQEESQKKVLRRAFSRYVAPEVVERITRQRGNLFAGEERELSIMFTDIRNFTGISETLGPDQVVRLLNRYFTPMTALVKSTGGTLDKFIGDALMAFWNAPLPVEGHPLLAVQTAMAMQEKLAEINSGLKEEFGHSLSMGVGVHTGKVYVGNMGSADLLNYTLIGDNVNLTSRLEGLCAQYGVKIVVSGATMSMCGDAFAFPRLDRLRVKGKQQAVDVFAAMRWEEWHERREEMEANEAAYMEYSVGHFSLAARLFSELLERWPEHKIYQVYSARCRQLAISPPLDWDGVWTNVSK